MSILGNRVLRREDPKFLTVGGTYVADLDLPGSVHLTFVRSSMAHARLVSVDTSRAESMPGVIAVYTNDDLAMANLPTVMGMTQRQDDGLHARVGHRALRGRADRGHRRRVARDRGRRAEQVVVEYDPLTVVIDPVQARKDENLLFPDAGTNTAFTLDFGGDDAALRRLRGRGRAATSPTSASRRVPSRSARRPRT